MKKWRKCWTETLMFQLIHPTLIKNNHLMIIAKWYLQVFTIWKYQSRMNSYVICITPTQLSKVGVFLLLDVHLSKNRIAPRSNKEMLNRKSRTRANPLIWKTTLHRQLKRLLFNKSSTSKLWKWKYCLWTQLMISLVSLRKTHCLPLTQVSRKQQ